MDVKMFPSSPLDLYRKKASFDWYKLKSLIESDEMIQFKADLINELKSHPIFNPSAKTLSLDELRYRTAKRLKILMTLSYNSFTNSVGVGGRMKFLAMAQSLFYLDPGLSVKLYVNRGLFLNTIRYLGTEKHHSIIEDNLDGKSFGCFCLTEIGHGSNTKGMRTTATFDLHSKNFVIHTPDFQAAKCWAGLLGQSADHALVFAQLYTPDGQCHGLHQFVVPIRDPKTMLTLPGITLGDMGEKQGLNGTDNGFILFNNYHVEYDCLLNKIANVNDEGVYKSELEDPTRQFGASFIALALGRTDVSYIAAAFLRKGVAISIRYAAVRKQFGLKDQEEFSILEYQAHQYRLFPYLAGAYALNIFTNYIALEQYTFHRAAQNGNNEAQSDAYIFELHSISAACKSVISWFVRDGLQECRECCGGHGYLTASGIADMKNGLDALTTLDGENHVLIQQTSNWLIKLYPYILGVKFVPSPFGSISFLSKIKEIVKEKFVCQNIDDITNPEKLISIFQWLTCYLLTNSYNKYKTIEDSFTARNENQVFYAKDLAVAYLQHFVLQKFLEFINNAKDNKIKLVLNRLFALYALFSIEKHTAHFYQGGYFIGDKPVLLLRAAILKLCADLKDDAVALVDSIAPDDFLMGSVLGCSDGKVYERLESILFHPDAQPSRPIWWKDVLHESKM